MYYKKHKHCNLNVSFSGEFKSEIKLLLARLYFFRNVTKIIHESHYKKYFGLFRKCEVFIRKKQIKLKLYPLFHSFILITLHVYAVFWHQHYSSHTHEKNAKKTLENNI